MGSNNNIRDYYGEAGNEGFSSSSPSLSRRGKKAGSSDKPKKPQRGLGVAQLEKIRLLHTQNYLHNNHPADCFNHQQEETPASCCYSPSSSSFYSSSSPPKPNSYYGYQAHHDAHVMMDLREIDRTNIIYGDMIHSSSIARWNHPGNAGMGTQHLMEPIMTRRYFEPVVESSGKKMQNNKDGNGSQNLESSSSQEIDLELRL